MIDEAKYLVDLHFYNAFRWIIDEVIVHYSDIQLPCGNDMALQVGEAILAGSVGL